MSNLVILKCTTLNIKQILKKWPLFFRSKLGFFDIFSKKLCKASFEDLEFNIAIENFKPVLLCAIKWRPLKVFVKLYKSPLLIASIVKGAVSGRKPLKIHGKCLLFHFSKLILLLTNQILLILCILIKPNVWYFETWKYWPLKMVSVQFWKNFTVPPFWGRWTKKLQAFSRHFFWEWPSKYCIVEVTAIFVCFLLSWSRRYSMKWSSNFDGP